MKKLLIMLSFIFVFALVPSVFAQTTDTALPSPGILPDSPIYFLKPFSEKIRGMFIFGEDNKAQYSLTLVDKRLSEAKALSNKGKNTLAGDAAEQAGKENENAQKHLSKAGSEGKDITTVVNRLKTNSDRQQAVLAKVLEKAPEQAKSAIQKVMETSKRGLTKAQEMQTKGKGKPGNKGKSEGGGQKDGTQGKPNGGDGQGPGGQNKGGPGGPNGGGGKGPGGNGPRGGGQGGPGGGGNGGGQGGGNGGGR